MSIARHSTYNLVGAAIPILVSIVTVPLYLKAIGLDRYGVLAICWLLVGYFNLFDFGLGRATAQKIAALDDAPAALRNRIFWTAAVISAALSAVAIIAFFPLAELGLSAMDLKSAKLRIEIRDALPLLVAAVPFGIAQSFLAGTLEGRREFLKLNIIMSSGTVATAVLPLLAALFISPALDYLLAFALFARVLVLILLAASCVRAVPLSRPRIAAGTEVRNLLRFGGWMTITTIIAPLMVVWDRFVIGLLLGSAAVAIYVVPFNLVWQILILPASLAAALFPKLASASVDESERLSSRAMALLSFGMTPVTLVVLFAAPPFFLLWLGSEMGQKAAPIGCILLFGLWANSFARLPSAQLQARARPHLIAYIMLAEIIPYAASLYLLTNWLGLMGAALAWSLRCFVDTIILFRVSKTKISGLRGMIGQCALILTAIALAIFLPAWSPLRLIAMTIVTAIGAAIVWHNRPEDLRQLIASLLGSRSRLGTVTRRREHE